MKRKNDIRELRKQNQQLILDMIYKTGIISRAELSKQLELSKPAVNEHIDFLLSTDIIHEVGEGSANVKGGRKPIMIAPNENYRYIITIDLGLTRPLVALGNMLIPALEKAFIDQEQQGDDLNQALKQAIDWLLKKRGVTHDEIGVIVISAPGIVNSQNEIILRNKQHELTYNKDLSLYLSGEYGKKVLIKNDVNMAVLAEKEILERQGYKDFILLACGNGFGAGIILNGQLLEGRNKAAGEVGFMRDGGKTLEDTITIQPLLKKITAAVNNHSASKLADKERISFVDVLAAYQDGDQIVLTVLKEIGYKLGVCANNAIALLDFEMILLGGDYLAFQEVLIPEMAKVIDEAAHFVKPVIVPAAFGHNSGIIGCINVARDYLIKTIEDENGGN